MLELPTPDPFGELSEPERRLVAEAAAGTILALDEDETVRAIVVRALVCCERVDWPVAPEGVRLKGGRIVGLLDCAERTLDRLLYLSKVNIPDGIDLTNAHTRVVVITASCIGGLRAQAVRVDGNFFLNGITMKGACNITSSIIEGQFAAVGSRLENSAGPAIEAQASRMRDVVLSDAVVRGECNFVGAEIDGIFLAKGAVFNNPDGYAINAAHAKFGSFFLTNSATVNGTLSFRSSEIAKHFEVSNTVLTGGPDGALYAPGIEASGAFVIGRGTRTEGAIVLAGGFIRGRLDLSGSRLVSRVAARKTDGFKIDDNHFQSLALDLSETEIGQLIMPDPIDKQYCDCARPHGIVNLSRARVGTLTDFAAGWPDAVEPHSRTSRARLSDANNRNADHLVLDGLEYQHLDHPDGNAGGPADAARLRWLRAQSRDDLFARLKPQPWRHLARTLAAQGYEEEARRVAIARRVAQRHASDTGRFARGLSWLLHVLADYGFNPWKAVAWSGAVILACALVYSWAAVSYCTSDVRLCADGTVFVRTVPADFVAGVAEGKVLAELVERYPVFDPLAYSFDVFLPLFDVGTERFWRVNTTTGWGLALYYFTIAEQIAGALLISLIVTGFTGLLTRDEA